MITYGTNHSVLNRERLCFNAVCCINWSQPILVILGCLSIIALLLAFTGNWESLVELWSDWDTGKNLMQLTIDCILLMRSWPRVKVCSDSMIVDNTLRDSITYFIIVHSESGSVYSTIIEVITLIFVVRSFSIVDH